jgi:hypothetical protein
MLGLYNGRYYYQAAGLEKSTKSHVHFLSLRSFIQGIRPGPRLLENFRNKNCRTRSLNNKSSEFCPKILFETALYLKGFNMNSCFSKPCHAWNNFLVLL